VNILNIYIDRDGYRNCTNVDLFESIIPSYVDKMIGEEFDGDYVCYGYNGSSVCKTVSNY